MLKDNLFIKKKSNKYIIKQKLKFGWKPKPIKYKNKEVYKQINKSVNKFFLNENNNNLFIQIVYFILYLVDKKYDHIITNIEYILSINDYSKILSIESKELPKLFNKTSYLMLLKFKHYLLKKTNPNIEIQTFISAVFMDCITLKKYDMCHDVFVDRYKNIYNIFIFHILPIIHKYRIIQKVIYIYYSASNGSLKNYFLKKKKQQINDVFIKSLYSNVNHQMIFAHNIFLMILKHTSESCFIHKFKNFVNIFNTNSNKFERFFKIACENPQFTKREIKLYLYHINESYGYCKKTNSPLINSEKINTNNTIVMKLMKKVLNGINRLYIYSMISK